VSSAGYPARRGRAAARRWLAGAVAAGLLAGPAAVTALPVLAARASVTPADQFRAVSCPSDRFCLGVGWYVPSDGVRRPLAERWDGSSWHVQFPAVPAGAAGSQLDSVSCPTTSVCLALGQTGTGTGGPGPGAGQLFAERWNGRTWRMVPVSDPGRAVLTAMSCAGTRSCFAAGYRTTAAGANRAMTERWNGLRWSWVTPRRPRPFSQLLGVSCPGKRDCYASGWTGTSRFGSQRALIERWDGGRWSTRPLPGVPGDAQLRSVSCATGTRCTAVGEAGATGNGGVRMLVDDLAGGRWTASEPTQKTVRPGNLGLEHVACRAPRECSAITRYIDTGDDLTWAIVSRGRTGGFRFQILPGGAAFDDPFGLSCSAHLCLLVGGKNDNDGRGQQLGTGSTLAWRGTGTGFAPVPTPPPPASVGGR